VRRRFAIGLVAMLSATAAAGELKNWFNDPYFQVRDAIPGCPVPRGPLIDEADMRKEAHARVERGTSCWLAGRCAKANAYQYDAAIGDAVRRRFAGTVLAPRSSLWVTVQRRIVWVEGCAADAGTARELERRLRDVPDVERVIVHLARRAGDRPPYPTLAPAAHR
jgi:hypothetical protein